MLEAVDPRVVLASYQGDVRGELGRHDVHAMMVAGFSNPWVSGFYVLAVGLLCFHLSHGVGAMFSSLGLKNEAYEARIDAFAKIAPVAQQSLIAMGRQADESGIDKQIIFPTKISIPALEPGDLGVELARCYNNWVRNLVKGHEGRLLPVAIMPAGKPDAMAAELRRCVKELGAVAVIGTPNPVNGQHLHDEACEPLWTELEKLDVPVGFHPTGNSSLKDDAGARYVGHANFHPIAHAIRNPVELMGAIASMTTGGVLERHPGLRCAFLEGTAGWLYWWLWRLDDQWEKFGPGCERQLTLPPSEYFKRQCYLALEADEEPAVDVVEKLGADYFVVSTDYPHPDGAFPEAMKEFLALSLDDAARRKILWDNCARLYNIPKLAAPLTRAAPAAAAAQ